MRSQNFVSLYGDEYQFSTSASNTLLDQQSKLNISWERKPFKSQPAVHCTWASLCYVTHFGTSIYDLKNFVCVLLTCCEKCIDLFCFVCLFRYRVDIRAREISWAIFIVGEFLQKNPSLPEIEVDYLLSSRFRKDGSRKTENSCITAQVEK